MPAPKAISPAAKGLPRALCLAGAGALRRRHPPPRPCPEGVLGFGSPVLHRVLGVRGPVLHRVLGVADSSRVGRSYPRNP